MAATRKPGSILDLLPRCNSVQYNALPKFIRDQVDEFRRSGGHTMSADDLAAVAALTEQIRALGVEQRVLGTKISDVHKAQSELGGRILAAIAEVQKEQAEQRLRVGDVEKRVDGHDVQLGVHAKKHADTATEIIGIHQRVAAVEQHITKERAPKRRKKGQRQ